MEPIRGHIEFAPTPHNPSDQTRIAVAEDTCRKLRESRGVLLAALMGVRGLAETEARLGGSKVWAKAVLEIDRCIKEASL